MSKGISYDNIMLNKEVEGENDFISIKKLKYMLSNKKLAMPGIHSHQFYEIGIVMDGECEIQLDFKKIVLKKGNVFLFSPYQIHDVKNVTKNYEAYLIKFNGTLFDNPIFFKDIEVFKHNSLILEEKQYVKSIMLMQELMYEFNQIESFKDYALESLLKCFLINIQRALPDVVTKKKKDEVFSRFNYLIVQNGFKIVKPREYAKELNISSRMLNDIVKDNANMSTNDYINSKVIYEAKRLLTFTDLSVKDIANELDFIDVGYFSRFFKKKVGEAPVYFRENNN